jgi:hypothetical protein
MAFSDFKTVADVQTKYRIKYTEANFVEIQPMKLPEPFREEFEFNRTHLDIFTSEASRCELAILPLIREVYKAFFDKYILWVRKSITYDDDLNGTPDYMVSTRSELGKTIIGLPLVMIVEAKKNDFEQGWAQCLSELYAAQKLNGDDSMPIYGIVTDGNFWQFGKLLKSTFVKNTVSYSIDDLSELFSAVMFIFQAACGEGRGSAEP